MPEGRMIVAMCRLEIRPGLPAKALERLDRMPAAPQGLACGRFISDVGLFNQILIVQAFTVESDALRHQAVLSHALLELDVLPLTAGCALELWNSSSPPERLATDWGGPLTVIRRFRRADFARDALQVPAGSGSLHEPLTGRCDDVVHVASQAGSIGLDELIAEDALGCWPGRSGLLAHEIELFARK